MAKKSATQPDSDCPADEILERAALAGLAAGAAVDDEVPADVPNSVPLAPPVSESLAPRPSPLAPLLPQILDLSLSVPMGQVSLAAIAEGRYYVSTHVEASLSSEQGLTLRRLWLGLDAVGEKLQNGRRVSSAADAVRWLLERIGPRE